MWGLHAIKFYIAASDVKNRLFFYRVRQLFCQMSLDLQEVLPIIGAIYLIKK
jgi:hypothetical protein